MLKCNSVVISDELMLSDFSPLMSCLQARLTDSECSSALMSEDEFPEDNILDTSSESFQLYQSVNQGDFKTSLLFSYCDAQ